MRLGRRIFFAVCLLSSAAWLAGPAVTDAWARACGSGATVPRLPGTAGRPANANVQVYIDPGVVGDARAGVIDAFNEWQTANGPGGNGSGVTFTFIDSEPEPGVDYHVVRPQAPGGGIRGQTDAYPTSSGVIFGASTRLDPAVTSRAAAREVMTHEIGHGMGLGDCTTCATTDSVMAGAPAGTGPNTVVGRPTSPTACDNASVVAAPAPGETGGGGGTIGGEEWQQPPEPPLSCTPYYRYGVISYDGGRTWYLEYARYEGCW